MIHVTKPYMPDIKKYKSYVDKIYQSGYVTNSGVLVKELQERLALYLGVKNLLLVSNGTAALSIAYKLLELKGEVITTPFSFIATTSSLLWQNLRPVFADINPQSLNIDSKNIESLITKDTSAIVPVHIFGNVCEVEEIDKIAKEHNLKVIYDAAHAFGVKYKDRSVLLNGDISILSFHATKLFHTIEGGALIIDDDDLYEKAVAMINFGYRDGSVKLLGTNAKMNEFEAAMGLCVLDDIGMVRGKREVLYESYKVGLKGRVTFPKVSKNSELNCSYFPILFRDEEELLEVQKALNKRDIFPRRYFEQSLDSLKFLSKEQNMPISRDISKRVLCLPMYYELTKKEQNMIIGIIYEALESFSKTHYKAKEYL